MAYGLRAVERDPRQPLAEDPAQVDVVPGRREPAIPHVGDVARLAVGADGDLPEVVAIDRDRPLDRPALDVDDRDVLRPRVADQQPRPVGRERDPARLAADRQPAGHLPRVQVDADDLVAHADRHVGRRAVGRDRDAPRLGPDLDPAGHRELVVLDLEDAEVVAVPVRDDAAPAVPREGHARRLVAGLDLVEHPCPTSVSTSETVPAVWLAVSSRVPSAESASAIGERCGSSPSRPACWTSAPIRRVAAISHAPGPQDRGAERQHDPERASPPRDASLLSS